MSVFVHDGNQSVHVVLIIGGEDTIVLVKGQGLSV